MARIISILSRPRLHALLVVLAVSAVELLIADRKYGVFSGGFGQSSAVDTSGEIAAFGIGFVCAQIAVAALGWRLAVWLSKRSGGPVQIVNFAFLYGGLSLIALTLQYQLHSYFSDALSFALLKQLGGGSTTDALLFAKNEIALGLAAFAAYCLAWWVTIKLARRFLGDMQPALRNYPGWKWIGGAWVALFAAIVVIPQISSDGAKGLGRILAWKSVSATLAKATDFDGDGYGLAGFHTDSHPFDSSRHPLALDIPGNGIDEDGYGGDLTLVPIPQMLPETTVDGDKPHVVVVVYESTRFDVLGKTLDGKPVAPNLEAVAAQGSAITPAYSHVGFTTQSLKSIFAGSLIVPPGSPSLFRELKKSGYGIGVFSGQPEDFGGISEAVGMRENADIFVDAENLKEERAFSFAAQGSLLVDEQIILREFGKALGNTDDWEQPQFVYLNFQSPHFPYHHDGVPERFARPPVERSEISAENRERVVQTYWNAVAHTDDALGSVIERLKAVGAWDNTILLVTGDHGEALFENGFLGHGHVINRLQYGTFLVSNRTIEGVEGPIAISDYRRILHRLLGSTIPEQASFAPFMHIGPLDEPTAIGMAHPVLGVISLRFDRGEACFEKPAACKDYSTLVGAERDAMDALIARWGSERWAAAQ